MEFTCGEGEPFEALDLVIKLMYPGETDEFITNPDLAYGLIGLAPELPRNTAINFQVTLIEVQLMESPDESGFVEEMIVEPVHEQVENEPIINEIIGDEFIDDYVMEDEVVENDENVNDELISVVNTLQC